MKRTLGILGGGRAAWAFGSSWRRIGWPIGGVWLRSESQSRLPELLEAPRRTLQELADECEVLLIAVSDRAIHDVSLEVPAPRRHTAAEAAAPLIFHASGALTSVRGGFSLHPLKVLPPVGEPSDLAGSLLVFEGNHRGVAQHIADAVGARFAEIAADQKARYHAAAVFGANYVAAVLDIAARLIPVENARGDLAALAESAIRNWLAHDDAKRFTGPAARGDSEVLERHLAALRDDPQVAQIYRLLADRIAGSLLATGK